MIFCSDSRSSDNIPNVKRISSFREFFLWLTYLPKTISEKQTEKDKSIYLLSENHSPLD